MSPLAQWSQIENQFHDNVILGNGASIAVHQLFHYQSLLNVAENNNLITQNVSGIFRHLQTQDFELVLKMLWHTFHINQALGVADNTTAFTYYEIRRALIEVIRSSHVSYQDVENKLEPIGHFLHRFRTVINLNYDLIVYWSLMAMQRILGRCLKDCFRDGQFLYNDWRDYRNTIDNCHHSTLVFYPHGSLFLATEVTGDERKIASTSPNNLLDTVLQEWASNRVIPLFVSEGASWQKVEAINRSRYLRTIFSSVLPSIEGGSMLIYGWSMSSNDEHLIRALITPRTPAVAFSVRTTNRTISDIENICRQLEARVRTYSPNTELYFFDAASPGCWFYT